ncbi:MAG TPA: hypothetical protein PKB14_14835 [Rubrivivax sp.]|nr:hypothetical protein [Rubrivivax sp.]
MLRAALIVGGMLLMLGALILGLMLATGVMLWALVRGRRPAAVDLRWSAMRRPASFGQQPQGEVIDVPVREIGAPSKD